MKRYKLLKDTPEVEAGAIFVQQEDSNLLIYEILGSDDDSVHFDKRLIKNFDEWFKEVEEPKEYFFVSDRGIIEKSEVGVHGTLSEVRKSLGNYFLTEEDAIKHREWLQARAILLEDTTKNGMFNVCYDSVYGFRAIRAADVWSEMMFKTEEDALNSIKNHEKEWKIYLGVE